MEAIDPRQIDHLSPVGPQYRLGGHQFDRDAGPVADTGTGPGQSVEEGGFAGIRHPQKRNPFQSSGPILILAASDRRMITSVMPIRTCKGP